MDKDTELRIFRPDFPGKTDADDGEYGYTIQVESGQKPLKSWLFHGIVIMP